MDDKTAIENLFEEIKRSHKLSKITDNEVKRAKTQYEELKSVADMATVVQVNANRRQDILKLKGEKFKDLHELITVVDGEDPNSRRKMEFEKLLNTYSSTAGISKIKEKSPMERFSESEHVAMRPKRSLTGPTLARSAVIRRPSSRSRLSMSVRASSLLQVPKDLSDEKKMISMSDYNTLIHTAQLQREKIEELTNRLSKLASERLTEGNPAIADLSDRNRPTKIGEKFGLLFDDEWSDAYDELKDRRLDDDTIRRELTKVTRLVYPFCKEVVDQQLVVLSGQMETVMRKPVWSKDGQDYSIDEMEKDSVSLPLSICHRYAKNFQKEAALASVTPICTIFKDGILQKEVDWDPYNGFLSVYVDKCIELIWLMCVQNPPMELCWLQQGEKIDKKKFCCFARAGDVAEFTVWPAVHLHANGPLVSKGYVYPAEITSAAKKQGAK